MESTYRYLQIHDHSPKNRKHPSWIGDSEICKEANPANLELLHRQITHPLHTKEQPNRHRQLYKHRNKVLHRVNPNPLKQRPLSKRSALHLELVFRLKGSFDLGLDSLELGLVFGEFGSVAHAGGGEGDEDEPGGECTDDDCPEPGHPGGYLESF